VTPTGKGPDTPEWGGLAPDTAPIPGHGAAEQFDQADADVAPTPDLERPSSHAEAAYQKACEAHAVLLRLRDLAEREQLPARFRPLTFNGAGEPPVLEIQDRFGDLSPSFAIVNPLEVKIYVGISGEKAAAGQGAFLVPAKRAIVLPVGVYNLMIGADKADLGAAQGTVFLLRFATLQPFFVGAL
jgi:hypothetical protein